MASRILLLGAVAGLMACAPGDSADQTSTTTTRTERDKDSLIARSPIPGAKAVQKSMNVADSASARAQRAVDTTQ
jgi:hypothetical protein